jgi:hypothetical protein
MQIIVDPSTSEEIGYSSVIVDPTKPDTRLKRSAWPDGWSLRLQSLLTHSEPLAEVVSSVAPVPAPPISPPLEESRRFK